MNTHIGSAYTAYNPAFTQAFQQKVGQQLANQGLDASLAYSFPPSFNPTLLEESRHILAQQQAEELTQNEPVKRGLLSTAIEIGAPILAGLGVAALTVGTGGVALPFLAAGGTALASNWLAQKGAFSPGQFRLDRDINKTDLVTSSLLSALPIGGIGIGAKAAGKTVANAFMKKGSETIVSRLAGGAVEYGVRGAQAGALIGAGSGLMAELTDQDSGIDAGRMAQRTLQGAMGGAAFGAVGGGVAGLQAHRLQSSIQQTMPQYQWKGHGENTFRFNPRTGESTSIGGTLGQGVDETLGLVGGGLTRVSQTSTAVSNRVQSTVQAIKKRLSNPANPVNTTTAGTTPTTPPSPVTGSLDYPGPFFIGTNAGPKPLPNNYTATNPRLNASGITNGNAFQN